MPKKISRDMLRGKKLEKKCYQANTVHQRIGIQNTGIFCYGLIDLMYDELLPMCQECKANVMYEEESIWEEK